MAQRMEEAFARMSMDQFMMENGKKAKDMAKDNIRSAQV
jgi:hypothetical protein